MRSEFNHQLLADRNWGLNIVRNWSGRIQVWLDPEAQTLISYWSISISRLCFPLLTSCSDRIFRTAVMSAASMVLS